MKILFKLDGYIRHITHTHTCTPLCDIYITCEQKMFSVTSFYFYCHFVNDGGGFFCYFCFFCFVAATGLPWSLLRPISVESVSVSELMRACVWQRTRDFNTLSCLQSRMNKQFNSLSWILLLLIVAAFTFVTRNVCNNIFSNFLV